MKRRRTAQQQSSFSRRHPRPSFANSFALSNRGRREGRASAEARGPRAKKMHGAGTTGTAGTTRPSPRDGFNAYGALSPVSGLLATVAGRIIITRQLGASIEAPGPRVFTSASQSFVGAINSRCDPMRPSHHQPDTRDDR